MAGRGPPGGFRFPDHATGMSAGNGQSPGPLRVSSTNGAVLLDRIAAFLGRFVAYPSDHARVAHTLWIAHTHLMDAWESTPRIAFLSPEPGSGKTRALELTELLVPRPVQAVNVTPSYLFRKVGDKEGKPTILFDEVDTLFGPKAKDNEEIRGILNAGHRRGASAGRCVVVGKRVTTEELPAYCAVALAGLGDLPDTILNRSVIIRMKRRAPTEHVEPFRRRVHGDEGVALFEALAGWAAYVSAAVANAWPAMPAEIVDRDADVWEALLAVADAAGENWPQHARVAAVALVADLRASTPSLGIRLLTDLADIFGEREVVPTDELLARLHNVEDGPWADLYGKALDSRGLANRLAKYQVKPRRVRIGEKTLRGYARSDMWDVWQRYVLTFTKVNSKGVEGPAPHESATSATSATQSPDLPPQNTPIRHSPPQNPPQPPHTQPCTYCGSAPAVATDPLGWCAGCDANRELWS